MTVDVGVDLSEFIDSLVKTGDYRSQSEAMRDAQRLLRDWLAEGISSGEAKPWNKVSYNVAGIINWFQLMVVAEIILLFQQMAFLQSRAKAISPDALCLSYTPRICSLLTNILCVRPTFHAAFFYKNLSD